MSTAFFARWGAVVLVLLAAVPRSGGAVQALGPSAPVRECGEPVQLQWSGSVGQTYVTLIDDANRVIKSFGQQPADTTSVTWFPVNATTGQRVYLVTSDATGQVSKSEAMVVGSGQSSDTCLPVVDAALPSFTLFSGASTVPPQTTATDFTTLTTSPATTVTTTTTSANTVPPSTPSFPSSNSTAPPSTSAPSTSSSGASTSSAPSSAGQSDRAAGPTRMGVSSAGAVLIAMLVSLLASLSTLTVV